ncbi:hypothetical protein EJ04DRAFT_534486 [Polyplosphaeria fusca]|uniref:Uncharacterized protein n=1 Tax=Polyplosphaeria fusca TaxID=682080 RepID=A0A9P4R0Y1_9PLEO|nr:hypothetical protein EJ04DRAFT_534486 [Polyplosphaeria fusca]
MNISIFRSTTRPLNCTRSRITAAIQQNARPQPFPQPSIPTQTSPFSTTQPLLKRTKKGGKNITDPRITAIRYHLSHPLTPRPLRFSRTRHLRHWTIHRAWLLFQRKTRRARELDLERQYMSMRAACEALRLLDESGNSVPVAEAGGNGPDPGKLGARGKEVGRLYRQAMSKKGISDAGVPIEYARCQTDFPAREAWNHAWTR